MYDILLDGGTIIDPSQRLHAVGFVAIKEGRIAAVGTGAHETEARKVFNVTGKMVVPGLIDIHTHAVGGFSWLGVPPDEVGVDTGVTLICDGGTAGAANFGIMRQLISGQTLTDMYCFLNCASLGLMILPEFRDSNDVSVNAIHTAVEVNRDCIKGLKIRVVQALDQIMGIQGVELAKRTAEELRLPLMIHVGENRERFPGDTMDDFSRAAVSLLDRGDILSHYLTWEAGGMILKDGTIHPELEAAQKRGVVLDSCHGLNHFCATIALQAFAAGYFPTVISTDMSSNGRPVVQSLPVLMSKFLALGLSLDQVFEMTTINPAKALGMESDRGGLRPGMSADIAVIEPIKGRYKFSDGTGGGTVEGDTLLEPRMAIKQGRVMPAFSGYHEPHRQVAGAIRPLPR